MIFRNVPCAWPLLIMERRALGYVVDTLIVFERVPGPTLAKAELDRVPPARRDTLFRRVGRILRRIEALGVGFKDLSTQQSSLEDIFVGLVHQSKEEAA